MSFGFSVTDFVTLAEKAHEIHKRCINASSKYADLTARVQQFREVLDDTKTFLVEAERQGQIPQSESRLASLRARCDGCNTTLDEVDEFLKKYKRVETAQGRRRIISLAKFIMSDAEALAKKLEGEASSLQLRLNSLTSLSVLNVRDALARIAEDYRTGVRQPSVISRALVENEPIERQELLEQISQDLEESNIHPDSISLNMSFVDEWLSEAISGGALDEGSTAPLLPLPNMATENKTVSVLDIQYSTADEDSRIRASTSVLPASLLQAPQAAWDKNVTSDDEDVCADADHVTTRPEDSITVLNGGIALDEPRSRSNSTTSSASKPDDWHPYDRPAPTYVRKKLWPLFHDEPTPDPFSADATHAIVRAFHQADYSDEGFLTRRTVFLHLSDALEHVPGITHSEDLESIVLRFDANHDGYFDKNEFLCLIQELMQRASEARDFQIETNFATMVRQARTDWTDRRAAKPLALLQWGFSKLPGAGEHYVDNVLDVPVKKMPNVTSLSAFSHMAWEANMCVGTISDFEAEWIGIVPKSLQGEYLDPLRKVQRVAAAFTLLENLSSRRRLSDLDIFLDCACIASYLSDGADTQEIDQMSSQLDAAKVVCVGILDYVLGFTFTLKSAETLKTSTYNNFGKFKSWWDFNRLTWRSNKISVESAKWDLVKDAVSAYRATQILPNVEARARRVVKDFNRRENERVVKRKAELTATPWAGYINSVTVFGWNRNWVSQKWGNHKVFLKISITDSEQLLPVQEFSTAPEKRAVKHDWHLGRDSTIQLLPTSTIEISVFEMDSKAPDGTLKYRSGPHQIPNLNFTARPMHTNHEYLSGILPTVKENGPPCDFDILVYMDGSPEFIKEMNSLEVKDWRMLLEERPPY